MHSIEGEQQDQPQSADDAQPMTPMARTIKTYLENKRRSAEAGRRDAATAAAFWEWLNRDLSADE